LAVFCLGAEGTQSQESLLYGHLLRFFHGLLS
jgi:hypothetical protein